MELLNIALHQVIREENTEPILNLAETLLDENNATVIEFVEKIIKSFTSKHPTYGKFQDDIIAYPFQQQVREFRDNNNFLNFSIEAMSLLKREIQVPQAKGGYVIFAHYSEQGKEYLITSMLDKAEHFTVNDDNLDIEKLKTLDIDRLARANRINFEKWGEGDETYLAFIKGTRHVSTYFQKFIGNTDLTSSFINSKNLKNAVQKYMREKEFSDDRKAETGGRINNYFENKFEAKEDIELSAISAIIDAENPTDFLEYIASDENAQVSGNFRVTKKSDFSMFHRAKIKGAGYSIEFELDLIRREKVKREGNNLIFVDLPEDELNKQFN